MKVYISNSTDHMMIYDHYTQAACFGDDMFYFVEFEKIEKFWVEIGDF